MDFDEDTLFLGNIPSSFTNELLTEMLSTFGEIKEFRRGRSLEGINSGWVFVNYHESASAERLYDTLLGRDLGQSGIIILPQRTSPSSWEGKKNALKRIESICERYRKELEKEERLEKFVSSYNLLYGDANDSKVFYDALKKWIEEESEIRRRCRRIEEEFKRSMEKKRQEEYHYLSTYDDDRSNDLFYIDRASWISTRRNKYGDK
ncbi:RNP domain-containing protein [Encephalitozoon hellem ATCC 50504]|uniref:RRM domain-containing protein n=1 Tax=Encephalitozoon hellem TaxID=27973 RepID=A0A9Q9CEC1_ENCHE|nr:RNP domain-containing protein [Encephalitozoon hellem ATCC 50504]AFM99310.1 RNP domain-containing protein [Encephalitozoon hellem ATCC 50504]UTX44313.1 RRM domain-containing protein [Encephalitozoon hellem]|eukprot:XP_003888291.1 RNP domain-containing protein [Encephalitozoon hellem ATCC 50504]